MYRNQQGLFAALEAVLKKAKQPLTCVKLYEDFPNVKKHAASANRVSDYLGGLWRKGKVTRSIAPKDGSAARWAYSWKVQNATTSIAEQIEYHGKAREFVESLRSETVYSKPGIEIQDSGNSVTVELPNFVITITKK